MKKRNKIILLVLLALCLAATVIFSVPDLIPFQDEALGRQLGETLPRLAVGLFLLALLLTTQYRRSLTAWKGIGKALLWSIPCFLVAFVNFPYTALISGSAVIERTDLLWLFLLKCFSVALMEELFFRALLVPLFQERFGNGFRGIFLSVVLSALLFSAMHLLNLFYGASFGYTALQLGYTFLLGCMFAVMLIRTRNVWLCVLVHFIFDIGGLIVTDLGRGGFQDTTFWALTVIAGIICAAHIVFTLLRFERKGMK